MRRSYVCAVLAISMATGVCGDGARPGCVQTAVDNAVGAEVTTVLPEDYVVVNVGDRSPTAGALEEGRGKKKKIKNTSLNMMLGGGMMTAFVVLFMFLNMITVTLGKAFLFTFIAKFLVSVNWKHSGSSSKKSSHKDITIVMD